MTLTVDVLGRFEIRRPTPQSGVESGDTELDLVAQSKRAALLVYLILARPRGFQRRDLLLSRFWPESDAARGRRALNQAIYTLRRGLGADVVVNRGDEELGITPGTIECDAIRFERLVADGNLADALELYRGDLLAGFHLAGAPDWEHWLDGERRRLGDLAVDAARSLARDAGDAGRVDDRIRYLRWIVAHRPDDESASRDLITALAESGDRAGASAAYDAAARRAETVFGSDVEPETSRLADSLGVVRRRMVAREVEPVRSATASREAPGSVPVPVADRMGESWGWWKSLTVIASVVLAAVLVSVSANAFKSNRSRAEADPTTRIVVLPFDVHGGPDAAYLREGIVDLLSTRLDGAGDIRSVDPRAVLGYLARNKLAVVDTQSAREVARIFGADQFVLGSLTAAGRFEASATLYDANGRLRGKAGGTASTEAQLFDLVDQLAIDIIADRAAAPKDRLSNVAARTTSSIAALKAFLLGEQAFRAGHFAASVESFNRAVEIDTTFALAWLRLSSAMDWGSVPNTSMARNGAIAVQRAIRFRSRLGDFDRLLVDARFEYLGGSSVKAEQLYRTAVGLHPDDADAWNELGEVLFHTGPWRGESILRSRDAFARVLQLAPDNVSAQVHLARLAVYDGADALADSLVDRVREDNREPVRTLELELLRAATTRDSARTRRALAALGATPLTIPLSNEVVPAAWRVAAFGRDPGAGIPILSLLLRRDVPDFWRVRGFTGIAHLEAARGRWRAALDNLDSAARIDPRLALLVRANLLLQHDGPLAPEHIAALETGLAPLVDTTTVFTDTRRHRELLYRAMPAYYRGLLAIAKHDSAGVMLAWREIDAERARYAAIPETGRAEGVARLGRQVLARWHRSRGRAADALAALGPPPNDVERGSEFRFETLSMRSDRLLRADLLAETGRAREALIWYDSIDEDLPFSMVESVQAMLRRADIRFALGERAAAMIDYGRFVEIWRNADPQYAALAAGARERLRVR